MKQTATYCPQLWENIFVYRDGNVYTCCHYKPAVLGNLYREKLEDIYNNSPARGFREKSLTGRLYCYRRCKIINKAELEKRPPPATHMVEGGYQNLKNLRILFSETCNQKCIMCRQDKKSKVSLDFEKIIGNLDISHFEYIDIQGGEPLFIRAAKQFFDYATSNQKKVTFLTNAVLITEEWAGKIARGSEVLNVSLNAATKKTHEYVNRGSNWEKVLRNIQRVREARAKFRTDVRIKGHMTLVRANLEEIPQFIRQFKVFGFDNITFGFDWYVPWYLKIRPGLRRHLKTQVKSALEQHSADLVNIIQLEMLGLV